MRAIYKRELKAYFQSFLGFLFMAAILFLTGLYFTVYNLMSGYPYFNYVISSVVFVFLISIPVLTMRILAEERKQKTDQMILTAPVTVGAVAAGKFLALLTIFAIPTAIISFYPLILGFFGSVPYGETYLGILGFFLYGTACISVGILISSLTESQVISAVLTFAFLFLGYVMYGICNLISSSGNLLTRLLGSLDMYSRFSSLLNGTLDIPAVIYFISFTVLMLFLTVQSIQKRRYSVSVKSLAAGAYSTGLIAIVTGLVVIVNLVAAELPANIAKVDVTDSRIFSLTSTTKEFVKEMKEEVTIYVLAAEGSQDTVLGTTLERYDELSDKIHMEYVDPAINPRFYTQYTTAPVTANSLIVVSDKRSRVIDYGDIYETSVDYTTYSSTTTGYDGEGQITSALDFVTSDDMPKIYLTEGHGELELGSTFTDAITKENIDYESINLMNYDAVPEDAQCLIIDAPTSDFSQDDVQKVLDYLNQGGNAIVISTWTDTELPNVNKIIDAYGLSVTEGLVIETNTNHYYQAQFYLLPKIEYDDITSELYNSYYVFAPYAQGIRVPDEEDGEITYSTLLSTSDDAFMRKDLENEEDFKKTEADEAGPFALGVRAVKTLEEGESTLLLYSCENLFTDNANQMVSGANLQLFGKSVSSLTESSVSVSIPVKSYNISTLLVPQTHILILALCTTVLLPLVCILAGFIIWLRRRKR